MLTPLQTHYNALEHNKAEALRLVRALSPERREDAPAPGEWSPREIVQHLVEVEERLFGEEALAEAARLPNRPNRRALLFLPIAAAVLRLGLRVPVPTGLEMGPPATLDDLERRWETQRAALRRHLDAVDTSGLHRPFAVHPLAGPLTAPQFLAAADVHLRHHLRHLRARR